MMSTDSDIKIPHAIAKARVRDGKNLFIADRYDDGTVRIGWFVLRERSPGQGWDKPVRVRSTGVVCSDIDAEELDRADVDDDVAHAACAFWDAKAHTLSQAPADGEDEDFVPLAEMCRPAVLAALCTGLAGRSRGTWDVTGSA